MPVSNRAGKADDPVWYDFAIAGVVSGLVWRGLTRYRHPSGMNDEIQSAEPGAILPVETVAEETFPWERLDDRDLLKVRICDLKVRIEGSPVEERVNRLRQEALSRGLRFHPKCYLSTEWLCPDRVPAIGIPFCLAHPRLQRLEKAMMLEVEGAAEGECMMLLRHELGHALNYAYKFYRRSRWRELFGPMSRDYNPHEYVMHRYSKRFVVHLEDNYAQAHPDEDFAETFAVWLTPAVDWRRRYRGWPALKKLEYCDHLMREIGDKTPPVSTGPTHWLASKTRATLGTYYKRKQKDFSSAYAGFYDPALRRLFSSEARQDAVPAHAFLSRRRKDLTNAIGQWAWTPKYAVDHLIRRLANRCRELGLYLRTDENEALFRVGVSLTALILEAGERYLNDLKRQENE